jgi:hypothetical protein
MGHGSWSEWYGVVRASSSPTVNMVAACKLPRPQTFGLHAPSTCRVRRTHIYHCHPLLILPFVGMNLIIQVLFRIDSRVRPQGLERLDYDVWTPLCNPHQESCYQYPRSTKYRVLHQAARTPNNARSSCTMPPPKVLHSSSGPVHFQDVLKPKSQANRPIQLLSGSLEGMCFCIPVQVVSNGLQSFHPGRIKLTRHSHPN